MFYFFLMIGLKSKGKRNNIALEKITSFSRKKYDIYPLPLVDNSYVLTYRTN